ncbi:unnamed protein product [Citrullus colocynthis]|uniref:Uncharacterized protein n=1 Tax=Citrullus colocynthis TaxID=252529 RepID=A0ABP0YAD0_9ROSI
MSEWAQKREFSSAFGECFSTEALSLQGKRGNLEFLFLLLLLLPPPIEDRILKQWRLLLLSEQITAAKKAR